MIQQFYCFVFHSKLPFPAMISLLVYSKLHWQSEGATICCFEEISQIICIAVLPECPYFLLKRIIHFCSLLLSDLFNVVYSTFVFLLHLSLCLSQCLTSFFSLSLFWLFLLGRPTNIIVRGRKWERNIYGLSAVCCKATDHTSCSITS